jgi:hypothetical protein
MADMDGNKSIPQHPIMTNDWAIESRQSETGATDTEEIIYDTVTVTSKAYTVAQPKEIAKTINVSIGGNKSLPVSTCLLMNRQSHSKERAEALNIIQNRWIPVQCHL